MRVPTASAKTAAIHFTETGANYLQPIFAPLTTQQSQASQTPAGTTPGIVESRPPDQSISFDAGWLSIVEQRIIASIPVEGYPMKGNTAWLQPQVGQAAVEFFRRTSTALPSEPYIYSSQAGDLVAEFDAPRGKMTCLISPKFVLVFAATNDRVMERKFLPNQRGADTLRSDIQEMTKMLSA